MYNIELPQVIAIIALTLIIGSVIIIGLCFAYYFSQTNLFEEDSSSTDSYDFEDEDEDPFKPKMYDNQIGKVKHITKVISIWIGAYALLIISVVCVITTKLIRG